MDRNPLTIAKYETCYALCFRPDEVERLAAALERAGRVVNGYSVEAVLIRLSEIGDPDWANELEFDSENDLFCVRCVRKGPLQHLLRRLERRLADPTALKRLIRSTREE
jgi:hypothetical protein